MGRPAAERPVVVDRLVAGTSTNQPIRQVDVEELLVHSCTQHVVGE